MRRTLTGTAEWAHKVPFGDIFSDESDLTFEAKRNLVVARLRGSSALRDARIEEYDKEELLSYLEELEYAEDTDEFDTVMSYIYDWADFEKRLWIDPSRQPSISR